MARHYRLFIAALLIAHSAVAQLPSYVPTNGLIMYLPFNGNANDASGNGNNGIVNGCTLTTGRSGLPNTAYKFNGTNNFIRVPNSTSLNPSSQITIFASVQADGFYNGNCYGNDIIDKSPNDNIPGFYTLRFAPSNFNGNCSFQDTTHQNFFFQHSAGNPSYTVVNNPPYIQTRQWYTLVATYNGTVSKIYVNGVLRYQWSVAAGATIGTNTYDLFIGKKNSPGFEYFFNGKIDDIGIWNRALTECEVSRLFIGNYVAQQPADQYVPAGGSATFTVIPGMAGARYQWQAGTGNVFYDLSNGGQYSGVNTDALTVANITNANQNQLYRCLVSDSTYCFTDTSAMARLTTNVAVGHTTAVAGYLAQNSPNPASGATLVSYRLTSPGKAAKIEVYDVQGKMIAGYTLLNEEGSVNIDKLRPGIYSYSLIIDGRRVVTKKMVFAE